MHSEQQRLILLSQSQDSGSQQRAAAQIEASGRLLTGDPPGLFLSLPFLQPAHIDHRRRDRTRSIDDLRRLTSSDLEPGPQDLVSPDHLAEYSLEQFPSQIP